MAEQKLPAGSIQIDEITITSDLNPSEKWNIKPLVQEFSIYESIASPFLTADLVMIDGLSLTTIIPIVGQETVHIKFKTPHASILKPIDVSLRIMSIENMTRMKTRSASYVVHLASNEHFKNIQTRIMQSYRQQTIADMVNDIHQSYLGSSKELVASVTEGQRTIVIPNMMPTDAINFLSREAMSAEYKASNFFYFETCNKFYFITLDELIKKRPNPVLDVYYASTKNWENPEESPRDNAGDSSGGPSRQSTKPYDMLKMNHFEFIYLFNSDKTAAKGGWENTAYFIDPIYSEFLFKEYDYFTNEDDTEKISRGKVISRDNDIIDSKKSMENYFMTNKSGSGVDTDQKFDFYHLQAGSMGLIDHILVEVNIPGDTDRRTGDHVELRFPSYGATDDVEGKLNKFVSGKYIVVGIRHIYNTEGYSTIMQCAKNAFQEDVLPANPTENLPEEVAAQFPEEAQKPKKLNDATPISPAFPIRTPTRVTRTIR